jgi:hypothetical protein
MLDLIRYVVSIRGGAQSVSLSYKLASLSQPMLMTSTSVRQEHDLAHSCQPLRTRGIAQSRPVGPNKISDDAVVKMRDVVVGARSMSGFRFGVIDVRMPAWGSGSKTPRRKQLINHDDTSVMIEAFSRTR